MEWSDESRLDLIDAIVYGDAFDAAVTIEEIRRFSKVAVEADELAAILGEDRALAELLLKRSGFFSLRDRPGLSEQRPSRIARARRLQRRALRVARVLRHAPFLRALVLTGSVAADDAAPNADLDLLVVVAPGRLGTVFVLLGSASRILGRQILCPNFYVSEEHLAVRAESPYVARELAQARLLVGDEFSLRRENPWLSTMFPNLPGEVAGLEAVRSRTTLQRLLEAPLSGGLGRRMEQWARGVARARLHAHYAGEVPVAVASQFEAGEALRFHGSEIDKTIAARYATRRREAAEMLMVAGSSAAEKEGYAGRSS